MPIVSRVCRIGVGGFNSQWRPESNPLEFDDRQASGQRLQESVLSKEAFEHEDNILRHSVVGQA